MSQTHNRIVAALSAAVLLAAAQVSLAQSAPLPAGPFGPGTWIGPFIVEDTSPNSFTIGPLPVQFSNTAGPLVKHLTNDGGQDLLIFENDVFHLHEHLFIAGDIPWLDWHEEIGPGMLMTGDISPSNFVIAGNGFVWTQLLALQINGAAATPGVHFNFGIDGHNIWFDFPIPLPPGTTLDIWKEFQFVGVNEMDPDEIFFGTIDVVEWPTIPAPAALPAGLALLGVMGLRRRARRAA